MASDSANLPVCLLVGSAALFLLDDSTPAGLDCCRVPEEEVAIRRQDEMEGRLDHVGGSS